MKKISLVLVLATMSAAPVWAGGNHHQGCNHQGGGSTPPTSQPTTPQPPKTKPIKVHGLTANGLSNQIPQRPGFVWVNNHWERAPASSVNNSPRPGYVWVDNHWERIKTTAGSATTAPPLDNLSGFANMANNPPPAVSWPGTTANPRPNGGVSVTYLPGTSRGRDVTGSGGTVVDLGLEGLGNLGNEFHSGILPGVRDHRH